MIIPFSVRATLLEEAQELAAQLEGNPIGSCVARAAAGLRLAAAGYVRFEKLNGSTVAIVRSASGALREYKVEKGKPCQCDDVKHKGAPAGRCKHLYAANAHRLAKKAQIKAVPSYIA